MPLNAKKGCANIPGRFKLPLVVIHAAIVTANEVAEALGIEFADPVFGIGAQNIVEELTHFVLVVMMSVSPNMPADISAADPPDSIPLFIVDWLDFCLQPTHPLGI